MNAATELAIGWTERGRLPDAVVRRGIRRLIKSRLVEVGAQDCESIAVAERAFVARMDTSEIAPLPHKANEQHYELPAAFFAQVLGQHRKYSSCYWSEGVHTLDDAETAALQTTCERAGLADGMKVLELGCGWGSLSLWMAEHYPRSSITGVSNSASQREHILAEADRRQLSNLDIVTADMNEFDVPDRFHRVVSVEMFEHMRNYRALFRRVHDWLLPGGRFFMHIFCHRSAVYAFEDAGPDDWMSRYFFSGGMMPCEHLPLRFQEHLNLVDLWRWSGVHYQRTAEAWLANMSERRDAVMPILRQTYGDASAEQWWMRWRLFFMACAELFGYQKGQQWWVSHYLFERPGEADA